MSALQLNAWWGGLIGAAAVISAAFGFAPDPPRFGLFESAQSQQKVLQEIDAPTYAPTEYEAYLRAVEHARVELAAQREKFYYSRQYLTFERLSRDAMETSGAAERAARENRASLQREVTQGSHQAREALSEIRSRLNRVGISNAGRSRLVRADVLLREAEILGNSNDWYDAKEKMDVALAAVRGAESEQQERMGRFNSSDLVRKWDRWVRETLDWSVRNSAKAIIVVKSRNVCVLLDSGKVVRSYDADLGKNSAYDKSYRGDEATPEGKYKIVKKKGAGQSKYYKALLINYPNDEDVRMFRRSRTQGLLLPRSRLGGLIEIHGDGGRDKNWTQGCVALHNSQMDDLFGRVGVGTPVTIVGNYSNYDQLAYAPRSRESAVSTASTRR